MVAEKIDVTLVNNEIPSLDELPDSARIILVLGQESGKTSLINTFLNLYEHQLSIEDINRFQLKGTRKEVISEFEGPCKKTTEVQAYSLIDLKNNHGPLVFIDTPSANVAAIETYLQQQKRTIDGILLVMNSNSKIEWLESIIHTTKKFKTTYLEENFIFIAATNADIVWKMSCASKLLQSLGINKERLFLFNNIPLDGPLRNEDPDSHQADSTKWNRTQKNVTDLANQFFVLPKNPKIVQNQLEEEQQRKVQEQLKAEQEKAEREKAEQEKAEQEAEREKAEREKAEREKAEQEKIEREKAEKEKAEKEKAEREKAEQEKAEQEKTEKEKAERDKAERDEREKAEREKAEQEKSEREKSEREQIERAAQLITEPPKQQDPLDSLKQQRQQPTKEQEELSQKLNQTKPKPNETSKTNEPKKTPSKQQPISMMIIGGFITVLGIVAVALALTLLNAASFGLPGVLLTSTAILGGIGLFSLGLYKYKRNKPVSAETLESVDNSSPAYGSNSR